MSEDLPHSRPAEAALEGAPVSWTPPDDAYTWERLPTDETTAIAVIEDLARAFELQPVKTGHWRIGPAATDLSGYITIRRDDAASVSVGLHFVEHVDHDLGCGLSLLCLILGAMSWLVAVTTVGMFWPLTAFVLSPVWLMLPAVVVDRVYRALQLRRIRRATDGWRDRLMPVVAARLAPGPPYR